MKKQVSRGSDKTFAELDTKLGDEFFDLQLKQLKDKEQFKKK